MKTTRLATRALLAAALAAAAALACSEPSDDPDTRPEEDLAIARLQTSAPPVTLSTSFTVTQGRDTTIALCVRSFVGAGGECARAIAEARFRANTLRTKPDGTPVQPGEQVTITLSIVRPPELLLQFEPSGLVFDSTAPMELAFRYDLAERDLDRDGRVDGKDEELLDRLAIWKQERLGEVFERIPSSVRVSATSELRAEIYGFTRFALAY
jgi:hypothetical protein